MHEGVVEISVTRRVPVGLVIIGTFGAGKKRLFVNTGVARLVKGSDAELLVSIFLDDAESILMSIEGGHENEGHVDPVGGIEMLNLPDGEIKESHVVFNLKGTLGASHAWMGRQWRENKNRCVHTHRSAETAIDLEDGELVEVTHVLGLGEVGVGDDLICSR